MRHTQKFSIIVNKSNLSCLVRSVHNVTVSRDADQFEAWFLPPDKLDVGRFWHCVSRKNWFLDHPWRHVIQADPHHCLPIIIYGDEAPIGGKRSSRLVRTTLCEAYLFYRYSGSPPPLLVSIMGPVAKDVFSVQPQWLIGGAQHCVSNGRYLRHSGDYDPSKVLRCYSVLAGPRSIA